MDVEYKIEVWIDLFGMNPLKRVNEIMSEFGMDERMSCRAPVATYAYTTSRMLTQEEMQTVAGVFKDHLGKVLETPVTIKVIPPVVVVEA